MYTLQSCSNISAMRYKNIYPSIYHISIISISHIYLNHIYPSISIIIIYLSLSYRSIYLYICTFLGLSDDDCKQCLSERHGSSFRSLHSWDHPHPLPSIEGSDRWNVYNPLIYIKPYYLYWWNVYNPIIYTDEMSKTLSSILMKCL